MYFLNEIKKSTNKNKGQFIDLVQLRETMQWANFDNIVRDLAKEGKINLNAHSAANMLSDKEKSKLVRATTSKGYADRWYMGMSIK